MKTEQEDGVEQDKVQAKKENKDDLDVTMPKQGMHVGVIWWFAGGVR